MSDWTEYPKLSQDMRDHEICRVVRSILKDIHDNPVLLTCPTFSALHDVCDANTLGASESLLEKWGTEQALDILNDAQQLVDGHLQLNALVARKELEARVKEMTEFELCTSRTKLADGRFRIACGRGQWVVTALTAADAIEKGRNVYRRYRQEGNYDRIIQPDSAAPDRGRQKVILSVEEVDLLCKVLEYHPDKDVRQLRWRLQSEGVSTTWMDKMRALALAEHDVEGTLEIDEEAPVAYAPREGGAYVMAFVWVAEEPEDEQKEKGEEDQESILRQHHRAGAGEVDP